MASGSSPISNTFIAMLGASGAGKSSFIQTLTGQDIPLSHGLESSTTSVTPYTCLHPDGSGRTLTLLDTPGLDGPDMSDLEVMQSISTFLDDRHGSNASLSGILFFHRISDPRPGSQVSRTLNTFRKLTGSALFSKVVFVTTMWDLVEPAVGDRRETILRGICWQPMLAKGARMERFTKARASAMDIVLSIGRPGPSAPVNLLNAANYRPPETEDRGAKHRPYMENTSPSRHKAPYRYVKSILGPATIVATAAIGWTADVFGDWVLVGQIPVAAECVGGRSIVRSWARTARKLLRIGTRPYSRPAMLST